MKKALNIFAIFIAVILLCGVTASCSKDDDKVKTVGQTIIVFQPYADNLTTLNYLANDLNEIKSGIRSMGGFSDYRVIIYTGSTANTAVLYELKAKNGKLINDTIDNYTSVQQNSQSFLTSVFTKIKEVAPAHTYKLIAEGHGSGWLPSSINYGDIMKDNIWNWSTKNNVARKSFGGTSDSSLRINVSTFSSALYSSGIHPQLAIFDICLMGNIETLYDFGNCIDYVVTTPAEQPGPGYAYDEIWDDIIATTSETTLNSMCQEFIDKCNNASEYQGYTGPDGVYHPSGTIGVYHCGNAFVSLANIMKEINAVYPEISDTQLNTVQRYDFKTVGIFYDILSYVAARIGDDYAKNSHYQLLEAAIDQAVPVKMDTGYFLANGTYCFPLTTYSGLAISDPSQNTNINSSKKTTNWWIATH